MGILAWVSVWIIVFGLTGAQHVVLNIACIRQQKMGSMSGPGEWFASYCKDYHLRTAIKFLRYFTWTTTSAVMAVFAYSVWSQFQF
jgi:hypothetical protein